MVIRNKFTNHSNQEQKRILLIVLPVLAVLMVLMVISIFVFYKSKTEKRIDNKTYQFFFDQKTEYSENSKLISGDSHSVVKDGKDENIADPSPIYVEGDDSMIIPLDTCYMDIAEGIEWRLEAGCILECNGQDVKLLRGNRINYLSGGFLHDGGRSYIFLDEISLDVDGITYKLPPMSFVSREANMFRIYIYGDDKVTLPPSASNEIVAVNNSRGYRIDIKSNVYYSISGERKLLTASPDVLLDLY